jgi:hypothetical protein
MRCCHRLYFGRPIVAYKGRFSPEIAFEILDQPRHYAQFFVSDGPEGHDEGAGSSAASDYKLKLQSFDECG